MRRNIGLLWIVGSFGLIAAAGAQTPSPPTTGAAFDGKYAFVSSTKVNETYTTSYTEHIKRCGDAKVGPLTVVNGQARYNLLKGTVGSQGELAMRYTPTPVNRGSSPGVEIITSGRIDKNGTIRARRMTYYCRYDLIWQKIKYPSENSPPRSATIERGDPREDAVPKIR